MLFRSCCPLVLLCKQFMEGALHGARDIDCGLRVQDKNALPTSLESDIKT